MAYPTLYILTLADKVHEVWKSPIMVDAEGGDPEAQRKWGVGVAEASTKAFRQWIVNVACDNLVALFCGHVHFPHRDAFAAGRYQYVTGPGFTGGYRKIMIVP